MPVAADGKMCTLGEIGEVQSLFSMIGWRSVVYRKLATALRTLTSLPVVFPAFWCRAARLFQNARGGVVGGVSAPVVKSIMPPDRFAI